MAGFLSAEPSEPAEYAPMGKRVGAASPLTGHGAHPLNWLPFVRLVFIYIYAQR